MDSPSTWPRSRVLAHNLVLRAELARVAPVFERHGIPWIVLKGLPLAVRVYGSIAERFCVDNDILVREADVARAMIALTELGYASSPGRTLEADRASTFQHPMRRTIEAGVTARLELHWNAFPPHLFTAEEGVLWGNVEDFWLEGALLRVFDPELTLVHLASHFVQHRCAEPRILVDVHRAVSTWSHRLETQRLLRIADQTGARAALAFVLEAAAPADAAGSFQRIHDARAMVVRRLLGAERTHDGASPSFARMALSLVLGAPSRWPTALMHELFPPPAVLARIFEGEPLDRPRALYARRMLRPLQRWLGKGQSRPEGFH